MSEKTERGWTAHFIRFLGSGAYLGYSPIVPGTVGTLWGIPLVVWVFSNLPIWLNALALTAFFFLAVWVAQKAEILFKARDSQKVVIDEIAGFLCTMFLLPAEGKYLVAGFFIFRLLDVVKPYPANIINQRLLGGMGIVLDDVVAGVYANLILHVFRLF
jgi:phosphatidylglycerophosphatase A